MFNSIIILLVAQELRVSNSQNTNSQNKKSDTQYPEVSVTYIVLILASDIVTPSGIQTRDLMQSIYQLRAIMAYVRPLGHHGR